MKPAQQAPHSITPTLLYSIPRGVDTHFGLLQNATDHVLANSAIASPLVVDDVSSHPVGFQA